MPSRRNGSPPEKVFRLGNVSASVFANEVEADGGPRTVRSVNVQRSYYDDSESDPNKKRKFVSSFGVADLPQVIRVLQLAQEHVESKEAAVN